MVQVFTTDTVHFQCITDTTPLSSTTTCHGTAISGEWVGMEGSLTPMDTGTTTGWDTTQDSTKVYGLVATIHICMATAATYITALTGIPITSDTWAQEAVQ